MQQHYKQRVWTILDLASVDDAASRFCDLLLVSLILLNTLAVILATVPQLPATLLATLAIFEVGSVLIFTLEYGLRVWACTILTPFAHPLTGRLRFMVTPLALIDVIAIVPFYLPLLVTLDVRFLFALRLLRLFRLLKIGRYAPSLRLFGGVLREKKDELVLALGIVGLLLLFASSGIYMVEHTAQPDAFSSIPAAMWWGIATLTTVGYGDIYPITSLGKVFGSVVALLGIGLFALPAGIVASGFVEALERQRRAPSRCPHCGKVIAQTDKASQ